MAEDLLVRCPEGVTVSLHLFIRSDAEDLDIEYTVGGLAVLPNKFEELVDVSKLKLPPLATDWRVMTRAEIADYKARAS